MWSQVYPTGKMGKHVDSLKIGDTLEMKVCVGSSGGVWGGVDSG